MSAEIQILVGGEPLDLPIGIEQKFYITKQLFDLNDLSTRNASFSKTISIPKSPTNLVLLGNNLPTKARFDNNPYSYIECEVLIAGVPMITDAYLIVGVEEDFRNHTVSITIYGGTAKFFNRLKEKPISDLNLSEYNLEWTLAGLVGTYNETEGVTYGNAQWYSNESRRLYDATISGGNGDDDQTFINQMELGESGLFVYIKTILDKIWDGLNLIVDDSAIIDNLLPKYERLAIPCNVPVIHDSFSGVDGSYTEVRNNNEVLVPSDVRIKFPDFPIITENSSGLWNVTNKRYQFIEDGFFSIQYFGSGTYKNTDSIEWIIMWNGTGILAGETVDPTEGGNIQNWDVGFKTSRNVVSGDYIEIYYRLDIDAEEANVTGSQFIIEQVGSGRSLNINISDILPDITQKAFVKNVFNYLGIVASEVNGGVTLSMFEDIRDTPNRLEIDFDISKSVKVSTLLPSYGRTNIMKYADNEAVERLDADTTFPVNSLVLRREATKIDIAFSASDKGVSMDESNDRCSIPQYSLVRSWVNDNKIHLLNTTYTTNEQNSIEAGDFISWYDGSDWQKRRVTFVADQFEGEIDSFASTKNDNDWNHWSYEALDIGIHIVEMDGSAPPVKIWDGGANTNQTVKQPKFTEAQRWDLIRDSHYRLITESLLKPFVFEAWAIIPISTFAGLNELDVVFVEEFNSHFYINKIDQWRSNKLCRVTFIELKL